MKFRFSSFALFICLAASALVAEPLPPVRLAPGEEVRYTLFLSTRQAGRVVFRAEPSGEYILTFDVEDRGRGQSLATRLALDETGVPSRMHVTGFDYWKNSVEERFEIKDGVAVWRNAAEQGERRLSGPAFYLSLATGHEIGLLAAALLRTEGGHLPLLPEGEARIEPVGLAQARAGERSATVRLYAISGIAFTPQPLWMDEQGFLFARFDGFVKTVREGWEEAMPALVQVQNDKMSELQRRLAARLSHRAERGLAIRGARLFDPRTGETRPGTTVVVSGNRIQAVGPDGKVPVPEGAEVVEAAGKTLLPGLWDMHEHLTPLAGLLDIASGVTTSRDMGNDLDALLDLRRRWDSGEAVGPRVLMACVIDGPGPYAAPTKVLVSTEAEAVAAVERYAAAGCVQIKIYSSLDPKLVPAIAARTHALGLRLSGHVPYGLKAADAVREGFDEIQHANFLFLNFLDGVDTRTAARMSAVGEHAAELDLGSEPVRAFLRLLKERGTVIDPTVNILEDLFVGRPGEVSPGLQPVAGRLPMPVRRGLLGGNLPLPAGMEQRYRDSFRSVLALVKALHDAGIPIVAGTDALPGFSLHRELEHYVAAGLSAPDALRAATLVPARVMGREKDLGTLEPGKLADLVLVDGDPAVRISDVRRVVLTIKDGVIYDAVGLSAAMGIKPVDR